MSFNNKVTILYLIREKYPTFRVDVNLLFGKYLKKLGIKSVLVAQSNGKDSFLSDKQYWNENERFLYTPRSKSNFINIFLSFLSDLKILICFSKEKYQAIQVRDKFFITIVAILVAKLNRVPFFFWLSFPYPEDDLMRSKAQSKSLGLGRLMFTQVRGHLTSIIFKKIIIPFSDHLFVQSEKMKKSIILQGGRKENTTPVPMAIDTDLINREKSSSYSIPEIFPGQKKLVYLGALDKPRRLDFLFMVISELKKKIPNIALFLVGDTHEPADREWLDEKAKRHDVDKHIFITGWLPMNQAWSCVKQSDIGICAIPPSPVFDLASPTKAVEYFALEKPIVVNDHPDLKQIINLSGGGYCVSYKPLEFANAIIKIFNDPLLAKKMSFNGLEFIKKNRNYKVIAPHLAQQYRRLIYGKFKEF